MFPDIFKPGYCDITAPGSIKPLIAEAGSKKLDSVLRYRVYNTSIMEVIEMESLTIGQLAKKAEVNIETIRYYERRGLIPRPSRRESGYRQYTQDAVIRIQFIKSAKELGFSLREIQELLSLRLDPATTCGDLQKKAEIKITDIEEKIKTLMGMKKALITLTMKCKGSAPVSECPILETLYINGGALKKTAADCNKRR